MFEERYDRTNREGDDLNGNAWHAQKVIDFIQTRSKSNSQKTLNLFRFFSSHDPRRGKKELLKKYGAQSPGISKLNNKLPLYRSIIFLIIHSHTVIKK